MQNGPDRTPGPWDHGSWGPPGYPPPVDHRRTYAKLAFLGGVIGLVLLGLWFRALPDWYQSLVVRIVVPILLVVVGTPWMRVLLRRARGPVQAPPAQLPGMGIPWAETRATWGVPTPPTPPLPPLPSEASAGELGPGETERERRPFGRRRQSA
jgi:hypothetical protein